MAVPATHLEVKIFVDKKKGRVVFAEAGGDFVDVLFSLLTLPIGTIVRLIGKTPSEPESILGCFGILYQSVEHLNDEYFCSEVFKDMLLRPRSSSEFICRKLKINIDHDSEVKYFRCPNHGKSFYCESYMSIYKNTMCPNPSCESSMSVPKVMPIEDSPKVKFFVTKSSKFIITDDLQVIPVVPGTVIGIFNNIGINDMSAIEGMTVKFCVNELIELLKRTLLSTTPLTDLFVPKNKQHVNNSLPKTTLSLHKRDCIDRSHEDKKIDVKVVLRKSNKEVLFVEAGHDFVDFLFVIPLGEALHLMEGQSGLGSIDVLYNSALSLDSQYCVSQDVKDSLLRPKLPPLPTPLVYRMNLLFPLETTDLICTINEVTMIMPEYITLFGVDSSGGFLREDETFVVLDNLALTPFSAESIISICNRDKLSLSDLEERSLSLGMVEVVRNYDLAVVVKYLRHCKLGANSICPFCGYLSGDTV